MATDRKKNQMPVGWTYTTFDKVLIKFESGFRPKGGVSKYTDGIPSLGAEHLNGNGGFNFEKIKYIPVDFYESMNRGHIENKDILIVKDGATTGKVSIVTDVFPHKKAVVNEHVFKCQLSDLLDTYFVFYFLYSQKGQENILSNFKGTAQGGINQSFAAGTSIPLASLPEQQRIVDKIEELFSDLDNGIEYLKLLQAKLKVYRQSVLKHAFEGKLTEDWRNENADKLEPAEKLLERIKHHRKQHYENRLAQWETDVVNWKKSGKKNKRPAKPRNPDEYPELIQEDLKKLPELPQKWKWAKLYELTDIKGGITKDQEKKYNNSRKIPYLRVANVQRGYLDLSEVKKIDASEDTIQNLLLRKGDVLFTEGGDRDKLGRGCVWNNEIKDCIHQNHIFRARLYLDSMSSNLISLFGNSFGQIYFMDQGKQTTNLASINLTKLKNFPVPIIPEEEQEVMVSEIESSFSICDKLEDTIKINLKKTESLRQSILGQAFQGKLVPQDPNDEPAEKLLERIKEEKQKYLEEQKELKKSKRKKATKKMDVK